MSARLSLSTLAVLTAGRLPAAIGRDLKPDHAGAAGRRRHMSETLTQLAAWTPEDAELQIAELGAAYDVLGSRFSRDPAVRARRITCKQLAELCRQNDGEPALSALPQALQRAEIIWMAWHARCDVADPRQKSMRETFAREIAELRDEVRAETLGVTL